MASYPATLRLPHDQTSLWRRLFPAPPPQARRGESPLEALNTAVESWERKARWNKRAARRGTRAIVVSSAAIPVVLLVSVEVQGMQVGQVLAGLLAAVSGAAAAFLQFNRPYADWRLYREYQRYGERERFAFENRLAPYNRGDRARNDKLLAKRLVDLQERLERRWAALVPDDNEVGRSARPPR